MKISVIILVWLACETECIHSVWDFVEVIFPPPDHVFLVPMDSFRMHYRLKSTSFQTSDDVRCVLFMDGFAMHNSTQQDVVLRDSHLPVVLAAERSGIGDVRYHFELFREGTMLSSRNEPSKFSFVGHSVSFYLPSDNEIFDPFSMLEFKFALRFSLPFVEAGGRVEVRFLFADMVGYRNLGEVNFLEDIRRRRLIDLPAEVANINRMIDMKVYSDLLDARIEVLVITGANETVASSQISYCINPAGLMLRAPVDTPCFERGSHAILGVLVDPDSNMTASVARADVFVDGAFAGAVFPPFEAVLQIDGLSVGARAGGRHRYTRAPTAPPAADGGVL